MRRNKRRKGKVKKFGRRIEKVTREMWNKRQTNQNLNK
jgi:hypothetical protein